MEVKLLTSDAVSYLKKLEEIQNGTTTQDTIFNQTPDEDKFIINADTREISVPSSFSNIGVIYDHNAETIFFKIPRYFDNVDLNDHTCIIQYINAGKEEDIYTVTQKDISSEGEIIFGWKITNSVTKYFGSVSFAVRFYSITNGVFNYNFNTKIAQFNVLNGLNITADNINVNPDILSQWIEKINALDNIELPMRTSELINDSNFLSIETDPTVPKWAKQSEKPTYTAQEVGAVDKSGGAISETIVDNLETIETKFPVPTAGETIKRFLGKVMTFLKNIKPLETDVTYYVATTGSDTTGDGSQSNPFKSITQTLRTIPNNLGGHVATILIGDGTYGTGGISIQNYVNGIMRIIGNETSPDKVVIPSDAVSLTIGPTYAVKFAVSGINFRVTGNNSCVFIQNTYSVSIKECIIDGNNTAGINWNTAALKVTNSVFNKCNFCIQSPATSTSWQTNSDVSQVARIGSCSGTGNGSIALIEEGILQLINNTLPETALAPTVKSGAMIVKGSGAIVGTLQGNLTLYVSPTGSDTTGDGTSSKPFKTIQFALNQIPRDLGGYAAAVSVMDGTYDEVVSMNGYNSGIIEIRSYSSPDTLKTVCRIKKIIVNNCSARAHFYGLYLTQTGDDAFVTTHCPLVYVRSCQAIENASTSYAFNFTYSKARLFDCKTAGHKVGVRAFFSEVSSENWVDSSATEFGLSADMSGKISYIGDQPNGASGIEYIANGGMVVAKYGGKIGTLSSGISVYVSTTGDNMTGNGTSAKPYKTIKYALDTIPKDLGSYTATVYIADGTYNESVIVNGFYNGLLEIKSQSSPDALNTVCRVMKMTVSNCSCRVQLYGIYFTQKDDVAFIAMACPILYIRCCQAIESATASYAFSFTYSKARMSGCKSDNHKICLYSYFSDVSSESWSASTAIEYGLASSTGATISKSGAQPLGALGPEYISYGGMIIDQLGTISASELRADTTIFVADTGNDTTGNGTQGRPYKTIKYALSMIPRDMGGFTATIYLADGTYDESVAINGYHSGVLNIMSQSSPEALNTVCKVRKMNVTNCSARVQVYGIYFTQKDDIAFTTASCHMIYVRCCQAIEPALAYVAFNFSYTKVRMSGCRSIDHINCVKAFHSEVSSENWTDSSAVEYGLWSDTGGKISKAGIQPGGTLAPERISNGGIMVSKYSAVIGSLQGNLSLYISNTGSDVTGNGTSAAPYATIRYAISNIPSDLGGSTVTIYLADGTYDEDVNISGYHSGVINLKSTSSPEALNTVCRVKKVIINNCSAFIQIYGLYLTQTDDVAFDVMACSSVYIRCCQAIESATSSPAFNFRNTKARVSGCKCLNHSTGIKTIFSEINSENWAASSSALTYGLHSDYGSKISKVGSQPTGGTYNEYVSNGGMFVETNGTQITNITKTGLSCTWGTIGGGYNKHGNCNAAMVTIQTKITLSSELTANTEYVISGFPNAALDTACTCSNQSNTINCYIDTAGQLKYKPLNGNTSGAVISFNCTYLTVA